MFTITNVASDAGSGLAQFEPSPPSARLKLSVANVGVAVGVAVGVGVGVPVGVDVGVGVGVGVWVAQFSLPMVINVPGELWLLYSVVTQLALRSIVETLTSSSVPAALSAFAARDMKYSELLEKLPMPEALRAPVVSV